MHGLSRPDLRSKCPCSRRITTVFYLSVLQVYICRASKPTLAPITLQETTRESTISCGHDFDVHGTSTTSELYVPLCTDSTALRCCMLIRSCRTSSQLIKEVRSAVAYLKDSLALPRLAHTTLPQPPSSISQQRPPRVCLQQ